MQAFILAIVILLALFVAYECLYKDEATWTVTIAGAVAIILGLWLSTMIN